MPWPAALLMPLACSCTQTPQILNPLCYQNGYIGDTATGYASSFDSGLWVHLGTVRFLSCGSTIKLSGWLAQLPGPMNQTSFVDSERLSLRRIAAVSSA